jgi:hypothetical protein
VIALTPGTTGRLNHYCRWPERCGLTATVVDVTGAGPGWPPAGSELVVHIPGDLVPPSTLPNGQPWSCVIDARSLDPTTGGAP